METRSYITRRDAIEYEIVQVLDGPGGGDTTSADYDVDAIAADVLGTIGEGTTYRYVVSVDEDEFWAAVIRHAIIDDEQRALNLGPEGLAKADAILSDPTATQALNGPIRLTWDGPAVGEAYTPGAPGTADDQWTVTVEVRDPDDPDTWVPLDTILPLPAGTAPGYWEQVTTASFSGAHQDPTDPMPYASSESLLLSNLRLERDRLEEIVTPW
ncbi:hypothetical protein [Actinomyces howellii]|uniref:Uncharacterized protein n=1 Tax=Actinomyces howellii TaxID=52771 RepID=A0A448HGS3_9ACTO|nr:hypothetical protein [Actinomyces howellii]VEG28073.1 Uncharacterised protein [Actinomyces howellii]